MPPTQNLTSRLQLRYASWQNKRRIAALTRRVAEHARPQPGQQPVVVFNASTRLTGLSLNAAFSLLTAWGLRLAGVPVIHFVCGSGMSHCVLGTDRRDHTLPPPCAPCIAQSRRLYQKADVQWWRYAPDPDLAAALRDLSIEELSAFEWDFAVQSTIPLGALVLPSIRWALRRHHLPDDEPTRYLLREYILSAYRIAREFAALLERTDPSAAVIFNGMMYPEAVARWVARQMRVRPVTHEVGFQRFSVFFTEGEATAYPIYIPDDFELTPEQNALLDANLEQRFQGKFTMAGIQFWPEMRGLNEAFLERASRFRQIVPVFTNVVYDTSQAHANVVFPHMFAWLDTVLDIIRAHPETLFVIRAHPDEMRPGTAKQSRESVRDWVQRNRVSELPNIVFIDSQEYISSYELIQRSKFVVVYNSSIGLEATLLGRPVLCGGRARYTQYPIVFFPQSISEYHHRFEEFLTAEGIETPPEFQRNARRFLYYQLFRASLPLKDYLRTGPRPGFVQLRAFSWKELLPERSPAIQAIVDGILNGNPFLLGERS
jgi:hypothetical protein